MLRVFVCTAFAVWMVSLAPRLVPAQQEPTPASGWQISEEDEKPLKAMSEFLGKANKLRIEIHDTIDKPIESGQMVQYAHKRIVSIDRPNRLRFDIDGDLNKDTIIFNNGTLSAVKGNEKVYAQITTPPTIDAMLETVRETYGLQFPGANLANSDLYGLLKKAADSGIYLGIHHVLDRECHHYAFSGLGIDFQLWIDATGDPMPRKAVMDYLNQPGQPTYTMVVDNIQLPESFPEDLFKFTAPAGAEKVEFRPIDTKKGENTDEK